jgi:tetratricopeptide (TPR) repeat protein
MRRIRIETVALVCLVVPLAAQDAASLAHRAVATQQAGDYVAAEQAWRGVIQLQPDSVAAHVNLGIVLVNLGRYDDAIAEYETADKLLPGDSRIALNAALAYEKSGRIAEAERRFEPLHLVNPDDLKLTMLLADCRLQTGDNAGVIELLQPVEAREPDNVAVAYMLGIALLRENRVAEGQQLLDRILRNGDSAEARFLLGTRMFEARDYPAAVKQLASAIELNAHLPGLQSLYGQALLNTGDPDAALAAFRKELANNPNDFGANLGLGQILAVRKQFGEAVPALQRALLVRPQSAEAKRWLADAREGKPVRDARADAGPKVNDLAPDFELPDANTGNQVRLSTLRGRSAAVLVFGSYSCPNFRGSADALKALQRRLGRQITFLLVYIREAHAGDQWQSTRNERDDVTLSPATTIGQKRDYAQMCSRKLHLDFPAVVDGIDGAVESAYHAWPSRVFVIGKDGRILYSTRLTELDFRPEEMAGILKQQVGGSR